MTMQVEKEYIIIHYAYTHEKIKKRLAQSNDNIIL